MAEVFSNKATTTLNGAINNSVVTLVVTSTTGFPTTGTFRIVVDPGTATEEIMSVTAVAGTTYTVTRASEAVAGVQTAFSHADLAPIKHVLTAGALAAISAISSYTEANTSFTLSAAGSLISATPTLADGTYAVYASIRTTTMGSPASPGTAILRRNGSQFGTQIDLRPTADAKFTLFGVVAHTGGSVTWEAYFNWEAGTTRFGVNGSTEARFGQKLLIYRIGG